MRLWIKGGLVVDPSQNLEDVRDILIEDGKIAAILPASAAARAKSRISLDAPGTETIDARGRWVLPGFIDMHVHLREPGREEAETVATGTAAAAQGGVTTVLAMPNTEPVIDTAGLVRSVIERGEAEGRVNVLASGAVTRGQKGAELAEMGRMAEAGAAAFTDDGRPVMNAQMMRRALEYAKGLHLPILDHCEDEHLSAGGAMNEGPACTMKGLAPIPAASETTMAARDIALAELTGGRLHLCHVSCAETVELVRRAKKRGVRVTAETAPHYFTLTDADIPGYDADFKMNPPLRDAKDVEAVRRGLADGALDAIATDHAPHSPAKKALGLAHAPFGIIGLETLLPLTLVLVEKKIIGRKTLAKLLCAGPARILGLKTKGGLKKGMDADVTIVDPKSEYVLARPRSKSRNTPFKGWKLKGRAETVLVGGHVVVREGRLT